MNVRILSLILAAALSACGGTPQQPAAAPPLEGARIGGPFALTDQNGKPARDTDFKGRYRIMYFGYTFCPDVCPVDVQNIGAGLKAFEAKDAKRAAKVVPIFVTVDPERDTAAVVKEFVANFHPRMIGLTGSPEAISAMAKAYGVYSAKQPAAPGGGYLVDHTRQTYLMDPDGKPMALLPTESGPEKVAEELDRWVK